MAASGEGSLCLPGKERRRRKRMVELVKVVSMNMKSVNEKEKRKEIVDILKREK